MHLRTKSIFMLALVLSAAGCSDPKEPNEANLRKAINAYYATHPVCTEDIMTNAKVGQPVTFAPGTYNVSDLADLQAVGVIEVKEIPNPNNPNFPGKEPWHVATILDNGMWRNGWGLCYGSYSAEKVDRWTAPAQIMGVTATQVDYRRKFAPAKWASEKFLKSHFKTKLDDTASAPLILMNDGWRVPDGERLF